MHSLAMALYFAVFVAHFEHNHVEVERLASDLIELSTRENFATWLSAGSIFRGWARSASGDIADGIAWIEQGIRDFRATGTINTVSFFLALKAEALHCANRTSEALEAVREADRLVARTEERSWCAELHRFRGVFLAALGADDAQIDASFREAISTAKEQKSVSLKKRAEASYAEYVRQRAGGSGRRGFRIPLFSCM